MAIKVLAFLALLIVLWVLFRFAMGLRASKLERETARLTAEASGRRVVAEVPLDAGLLFFIEEADAFAWGHQRVKKADVLGARLLLNGGVMASFGERLPPPPSPAQFEGRERWDVVLYLKDGGDETVPCGSLREGVSREIAARVFAAVQDGADFG